MMKMRVTKVRSSVDILRFLVLNRLTGDDWDELERKAAKADAKRAEERKKGNRSDDSDDDRPKKKKAAPGKANGKSKR